jgi:predicted RNase H-like HicB family nuclease
MRHVDVPRIAQVSSSVQHQRLRATLLVTEACVKGKREFTVVIERDEAGFYVGSVPELRGCYTQAKNLDTLMKRIREVIELCLEDGDSAEPMELVGVQRIAV